MGFEGQLLGLGGAVDQAAVSTEYNEPKHLMVLRYKELEIEVTAFEVKDKG